METSSELLRFPSKYELSRCLREHPLAGVKNNPHLTDMKVIEDVVAVFADQEKRPEDMRTDVKRAIAPNVPMSAYVTIRMNLTEALKDCAVGKPIKLEKKTHQ